jgi:hypothetical protein
MLNGAIEASQFGETGKNNLDFALKYMDTYLYLATSVQIRHIFILPHRAQDPTHA